MHHFTRANLTALMAPHQGPCVTLCMPTHRRHPESQQDPIRYANLVKQAIATLEKEHDKRDPDVAAILRKLEDLGMSGESKAGPENFWNQQSNGLAVFASPDHFAYFTVPLELREIVVVADSFHVKQLLPLLFDDVRYHVLALTVNDVRLFEGNGDGLEPLAVAGVPRSLEAALGSEWDDAREGVDFHGSRERMKAPSQAPGGTGAGPVFHGYGKSGNEDKEELKRFFRAVDRAVDDLVTKPSGRPLVLAAVDYYHPLFREVSRNASLVEGGVTADPKALDATALHAQASEVFRPIRERRLAQAIEEFGTARAHGLGSSDLPEVARAIVSGRVRRLLVEEKRRIWGRIDRATGETAVGGSAGNPGDADLLDDLAEMTLERGGEVRLVPAARMPADTGLAALYRY